ncbi:MAG: Ig-like domain-containing protein [Salinivirgaceae bacterium]|nr:Ig-like domain-containing protein [Salinivirgaceae bacterium]
MTKKIRFTTLTVILLAVFGIFYTSCKKTEEVVEKEQTLAKVATSIEIVSGDNQRALVETDLTNPVVVIVKDQNGDAFAGTTVSFATKDGSVASETSITDDDGEASVYWTLGTSKGEQTLTVTAFNADSTKTLNGAPFTVKATGEAVALVATSIEIVSGDNQSAIVETALENPVVILVKDQNGNAFTGAKVNFETTDGSVASETSTTNSDGKASANWILGATQGEQTLTVTAFKADGTSPLAGSPFTVKATGGLVLLVATSIELVTGDNQSAIVGSTLEGPVEVIVKDQNGYAFAGTTVYFRVNEGAVSEQVGISDADGKASVNWTLGATQGEQTLTISAYNADASALIGSPMVVSATGVELTILKDIDGNSYNFVRIGNQVWMQENLKVTHYDDAGVQGAAIPFFDNTQNEEFGALDDNISAKGFGYSDEISGNESGQIYGAVYTWGAAMGDDESSTSNPSSVQGICPHGWHLPSEAEWTELVSYLGGSEVANNKMQSTSNLWDNLGANGTNESGFSGLPGGLRQNNTGNYSNATNGAHFWSATMDDNAYYSMKLSLNSYSGSIEPARYLMSTGISVRCVRD